VDNVLHGSLGFKDNPVFGFELGGSSLFSVE